MRKENRKRKAKQKIFRQVRVRLKNKLDPSFFSILLNRLRVSEAPEVEPKVSLRQDLTLCEFQS
jgi:hypothetical protein